MSDWSFENGDGCPGIWRGNNELEYIRAGGESFLQDGKMIIEARKENYSGKSYASSRSLPVVKSIQIRQDRYPCKTSQRKRDLACILVAPAEQRFGGWPKAGRSI
jgi:hypothetical protein